MLAKIYSKLYRPHVFVENDKPVLYAELQKALYGMLQSALRFWEQVLEEVSPLIRTITASRTGQSMATIKQLCGMSTTF